MKMEKFVPPSVSRIVTALFLFPSSFSVAIASSLGDVDWSHLCLWQEFVSRRVISSFFCLIMSSTLAVSLVQLVQFRPDNVASFVLSCQVPCFPPSCHFLDPVRSFTLPSHVICSSLSGHLFFPVMSFVLPCHVKCKIDDVIRDWKIRKSSLRLTRSVGNW